jgi:hypothetical protein
LKGENEDQRHGIEMVKKALSWPARQIAIRTAAAVPGHRDAIERQALALNIRNDEHGPAGIEQRRLDEEPLERRRIRLRLAHDGQIEPPRDLGENVGGARDRYVERARLGRNRGATRGFIERGHGASRQRAMRCPGRISRSISPATG